MGRAGICSMLTVSWIRGLSEKSFFLHFDNGQYKLFKIIGWIVKSTENDTKLGLNWPNDKVRFSLQFYPWCVSGATPALPCPLFMFLLYSFSAGLARGISQESHSSFLTARDHAPALERDLLSKLRPPHFLADHYLIASHSNSHINKTLMTNYIIAADDISANYF